ncbi:hypothetical protein 2 [Hubei sobemo-like virus 23]|uniref:hypothetical protein 2 n=1 Tax=Hubei sobemo-like virus 23 TaxID=1923209 RepID=UPI00090CBB3D|nr:hypothetical protein 2 [Hubei sobemo-like virus 23]APG75798.1 hypothetical protein 2 [Hubei sobemo-like virus 23]
MASDFTWPLLGGDAELRSLLTHVQMSEGLREDGPSHQIKTKLLDIAEDMFKPARWRIPDDFLSFNHYMRTLNQLVWTSSPGLPYMRTYPNNGGMFGVVDGVPNPEKCRYWWTIVQQKIRDQFSDYIRVFIKQEPITRKKFEQNRFRLIFSVSVLDQIIDHMLFGDFNDLVIENWYNLPTKVGWSPLGGGWKIIPKSKCHAIDKRAWDWTVKMWLIELEFMLRVRLCDNMNPLWRALAFWRYKSLFMDAKFVNSGGLVFKQKFIGVMKSGCVNTIITNSIAQILLHLRICLELGLDISWIFSLGDDTLQELLSDPRYLELLKQFSLVKECVIANEFAGMRYAGGVVDPLYKGKHAFNILHVNPKFGQEIAEGYSILYHRSPRGSFIKQIFKDMGYTIPSDDALDLIWDGEE